jgi:transposase
MAPDWLREQVTAEWFMRYGTRFSDYQQPKGKDERQELAETIGRDGLHLLTVIYQNSAPPSLRTEPAVEVLRQVWVQQFYQEGGDLKWRQIKDCPPSSIMIAAPYDLDVR